MPNITSVGVTNGLGTSGTGTLSTLDNLIGIAGTANANVLTVQGIASGTAQVVDGSGVTQPISAVSLPLPTLAATAAKQDTGNTALTTINTSLGTVNTSLGTINTTLGTPMQTTGGSVTANAGTNLNTSTLALETGGNLAKIPLAQGSTTSGQSGTLVQGAVTTSAPTYTTAQTSPLSLDTTGRLRTVTNLTNVNGSTVSLNETSTVYAGATACTPLFSTVVAASSGAATIIAAVGGKQIRVLALQLIANAAVNVKWQSHVTPTDITGLAYLAANGGYVLPYNPVGWFQTISGEALDINLSASVAVGGFITYITV